jgi:phosphate uptake regulator
MKRKVIQIADSTQLVSLPRKWALQQGIKKGDEIEVKEENNKLTIETSREERMEKVSVDFDKFSPLTAKCALDVLHKSGYDEIEIKYTNKAVFNAIQERLLQLIGCDVVEQTDNTLLIKDITKGSLESEFDSLFKRVVRITLSMAQNGLSSVKKGNYAELKEFALMESTNNKLVNYCHRILTKKGYKEYRKTNLYYVVLWYLESVADDLRDLLNYIASKKKVKLTKMGVKLFEDVVKYFELFCNTFFRYDKISLDKLYTDKEKLIDNGVSLLKNKKDDPNVIRLLTSIPHKIFDILPTISSISAI